MNNLFKNTLQGFIYTASFLGLLLGFAIGLMAHIELTSIIGLCIFLMVTFIIFALIIYTTLHVQQ